MCISLEVDSYISVGSLSISHFSLMPFDIVGTWYWCIIDKLAQGYAIGRNNNFLMHFISIQTVVVPALIFVALAFSGSIYLSVILNAFLKVKKIN